MVYVPFRISRELVRGFDRGKQVVGRIDFSMMYADEAFAHDGKFVIADEPGDILVEYAGGSQAREGAYDNLLAGRLP
jgi:hypothetical protein